MSWLKKILRFREKSGGEVEKPFPEHLEDLRRTLIKMILTVVICVAFSFFFIHDLLRLMQQPILRAGPEVMAHMIVVNLDDPDPFAMVLKVTFFAGFALAWPFLGYFVLSFILPSLTQLEKKFLFPGIAANFCVFVSGVLVSYYYILPKILRLLYEHGKKVDGPFLWHWKDYMSFCCWAGIGFGFLYQVPLVMVALAFLGIINFRLLSSTRPFVITAILVLSAIVAPTPDPVTFIIFALPIILLYEICIWIVWLIDRSRAKAAALPDVQGD